MSEFIDVPGATRTLSPQAVVLLDPATGQAYAGGGSLVPDSTGALFNPDACSHIYGFTGGDLTTDTATDGVGTWVKTFGYTAGLLTSETAWVKQ
ncbi:MAG: hypothetical protein M0P52_00220 [Rhodoferax sp.]|nr:hypothetical protein [Rhodoferax sp.]